MTKENMQNDRGIKLLQCFMKHANRLRSNSVGDEDELQNVVKKQRKLI